MKVKTRYYGEIDLDDSKVITFEKGLFGFEEYTKYALMYDSETGESTAIKWLQSVEEPGLALPVIIPTLVKPDYDPIVEDGVLDVLGDWNENNISVLVTMTVPSDLKAMTTNMKAPIIINTESMKGIQVVAENPDYEIKFKIYDILEAARAGKEEN
ncbi:MAG: flagellar assembly protein FliW [Lachnospiraceae bacterium]|nr:flagellar assembly protein FliW [Lachnospiraceae bacterium]MBP5652059.1 flagellar assembly protein FliW [Lachnospiraceae bacterium]MCR5429079.1 flagellar assembly protein FliW [Lachnospiraceae bacterium]